MTDSKAIDALVEKLEKADGPSRKLFLEVFRAIKPNASKFESGRFVTLLNVEAWESAALTLVPTYCDWLVNGRSNFAEIWEKKETGGYGSWGVIARTPAIALCIVALRASAQQGGC